MFCVSLMLYHETIVLQWCRSFMPNVVSFFAPYSLRPGISVHLALLLSQTL
jgi:hypothetical protein